MTSVIEREPEVTPDEIAYRSITAKNHERAEIAADISVYLAAGGKITTLPPCTSSEALNGAAKRSFSLGTKKK